MRRRKVISISFVCVLLGLCVLMWSHARFEPAPSMKFSLEGYEMHEGYIEARLTYQHTGRVEIAWYNSYSIRLETAAGTTNLIKPAPVGPSLWSVAHSVLPAADTQTYALSIELPSDTRNWQASMMYKAASTRDRAAIRLFK